MSDIYKQSYDRLGITIFFACVIHALVIFFFSFISLQMPKKTATDKIEVTIAKRPSRTTPKEFDYIAQADQNGGGEKEKKEKPTDDNTALSPDVGQEEAPLRSAPEESIEEIKKNEIISSQSEDQKKTQKPEQDSEQVEAQPPAEINFKMMDIAQLEALNNNQKKQYAKKAKSKTIDPSTKKKVEARYIGMWSEKMQTFADNNFKINPYADKLRGSVVIETSILPNGNVFLIQVIKPSGNSMLDDTMISYIKNAAPYEKFPEELKNFELIKIQRQFNFKD